VTPPSTDGREGALYVAESVPCSEYCSNVTFWVKLAAGLVNPPVTVTATRSGGTFCAEAGPAGIAIAARLNTALRIRKALLMSA
jgi:hypothetical protein